MKRLFLFFFALLLAVPSVFAQWSLEGIRVVGLDTGILGVVPDNDNGLWLAWDNASQDEPEGVARLQHLDSLGVFTFPEPGIALAPDGAVTSRIVGAVKRDPSSVYVFYTIQESQQLDGLYVQGFTYSGATTFLHPVRLTMAPVIVDVPVANLQVASDGRHGAWCVFTSTNRDVLYLTGINISGAPKVLQPVVVDNGEFLLGQYRVATGPDNGVWIGWADQSDSTLTYIRADADGVIDALTRYTTPVLVSGHVRIIPDGLGGYFATADGDAGLYVDCDTPAAVHHWYFRNFRDEWYLFGAHLQVAGLWANGLGQLTIGNIYRDRRPTFQLCVQNADFQFTNHNGTGMRSVGFSELNPGVWTGDYEYQKYGNQDSFSIQVNAYPLNGGGYTLQMNAIRHAEYLPPVWGVGPPEFTWNVPELPDFPEDWTWMLRDEQIVVAVPRDRIDSDRVRYRLFRIETTGELTDNALTVADGAGQPLGYALHPAWPNPFNASARLQYDLPRAEQVNVAVYDLTGRLVATLAEGVQPAGTHQATLDGVHLASGIYLVRFVTPSFQQTRKVVLVK